MSNLLIKRRPFRDGSVRRDRDDGKEVPKGRHVPKPIVIGLSDRARILMTVRGEIAQSRCATVRQAHRPAVEGRARGTLRSSARILGAPMKRSPWRGTD